MSDAKVPTTPFVLPVRPRSKRRPPMQTQAGVRATVEAARQPSPREDNRIWSMKH